MKNIQEIENILIKEISELILEVINDKVQTIDLPSVSPKLVLQNCLPDDFEYDEGFETNGHDWDYTIQIMNVLTGELYDLHGSGFNGVSWIEKQKHKGKK